MGLACKNAILIVEFARELEMKESAHDPVRAALEACRMRLRPILMTSFAFIMGVVPLVLSTGAGAEMRHAMGIAVFCGHARRHVLRPLPDAGVLRAAAPQAKASCAGRDSEEGGPGCGSCAMKMRFTWMGVAVLIAGCSLAPELKQPEMDVPASFKELPLAERGAWKPAQPSEALPRGQWWKAFNDPVLDRLEEDAIAANQNLQAAAARVAQGRALVGVAKAERIPQVSAGFGPARIQPTGVSLGLPPGTDVDPYTAWRALLTVSYEVDLFGRVSDTINATRSDYESQRRDLPLGYTRPAGGRRADLLRPARQRRRAAHPAGDREVAR